MSGPTYTHPDFIVNPDFCIITYAYSETKLIDSAGIEVTAISLADKTFSDVKNHLFI